MSETDPIHEKIEASQLFELSGDIGQAFQCAVQALAEARVGGQEEVIAAAQMGLARVHFRLGHDAQAFDLAHRVLLSAPPDDPVRVDALLMIGMCGEGEDYIFRREESYHRAIDLSRQLGYSEGLLRGLHNLSAGVYLIRGQFGLAVAADEEALRLGRKFQLQRLIWWPLITLSWIFWLTGQAEKARATLVELDQNTTPGSLGKGYFYCINANLALDQRDLAVAYDLFGSARAIAETLGAPDLGAYVRLGLCHYALVQGDPGTAISWAEDALRLAARVDYPFLQGEALIEHGRSLLIGGRDLRTAEQDFRNAITTLSPLGAAFELARANLFLAAILFGEEENGAEDAWQTAAGQILNGGFDFLLHQEQALVYPLIGDYLSLPALANSCAELLAILQRLPPKPLRVTLLGGLQVWRGNELIPAGLLHKRRSGELLALLLVQARRSLSIEQVTEALSPGGDPAASQSILHHATSCLRQALEPELPAKLPSRYLRVENGEVTLIIPPGSWIDVDEFTAHGAHQEWQEAVDLFRGELLPDYFYSDWTSALRQKISQMAQRALLAVANQLFAEGDFVEALEHCRRIRELEPWHEQAVVIAMRACLKMENRAGALRIYRQLEKALREELDIAPDQTLQALAKEISQRKDQKQ